MSDYRVWEDEDSGFWTVSKDAWIADCGTQADAERIARALRLMEVVPHATDCGKRNCTCYSGTDTACERCPCTCYLAEPQP